MVNFLLFLPGWRKPLSGEHSQCSCTREEDPVCIIILSMHAVRPALVRTFHNVQSSLGYLNYTLHGFNISNNLQLRRQRAPSVLVKLNGTLTLISGYSDSPHAAQGTDISLNGSLTTLSTPLSVLLSSLIKSLVIYRRYHHGFRPRVLKSVRCFLLWPADG